jgi:hypothetical protein
LRNSVKHLPKLAKSHQLLFMVGCLESINNSI